MLCSLDGALSALITSPWIGSRLPKQMTPTGSFVPCWEEDSVGVSTWWSLWKNFTIKGYAWIGGATQNATLQCLQLLSKLQDTNRNKDLDSNEAFPGVYISAEDTVTAVIGSLEDKDILCLIQNGIQVITAIEVGSYHSSWVSHYLEALSVYKGCSVLFHLLLCWNMQDTKSLDPVMPEFNRTRGTAVTVKDEEKFALVANEVPSAALLSEEE
ncbi:hypothetical protein QYF61_000503, partial [Mycteria americana]